MPFFAINCFVVFCLYFSKRPVKYPSYRQISTGIAFNVHSVNVSAVRFMHILATL